MEMVLCGICSTHPTPFNTPRNTENKSNVGENLLKQTLLNLKHHHYNINALKREQKKLPERKVTSKKHLDAQQMIPEK